MMEPPDPASISSATSTSRSKVGGRLSVPIFDREAALARVEGDQQLLQELVRVFLDDCPRLLADIRAAAAAGDAARLARAAHSFRGAVGNFAASVAEEAGLRLEQIGSGGDMSRAGGAVAELEQALQHLRAALLAAAETGG